MAPLPIPRKAFLLQLAMSLLSYRTSTGLGNPTRSLFLLEVLLMEREGPLSSQNHFLWRGHGSSPYSLRDRFEMLVEGLSP